MALGRFSVVVGARERENEVIVTVCGGRSYSNRYKVTAIPRQLRYGRVWPWVDNSYRYDEEFM